MKIKLLVIAILTLAVFGIGVDAAQPIIAPTNVTATAVGTSQINLNWQDNSGNENGFKIERSLNCVSFVEIAQVASNITSYSDSGLVKNTNYCYKVRAFKLNGKNITYSAYSNTASAITFDTAPQAPSNLLAISVAANQINLFWQDNANNEQGYKIERSLDCQNFAQIAITAQNQTSYSDIGLSPITNYCYRVVAFNAFGDSAYSNISATSTFNTPPQAPTGLSAELFYFPSSTNATATGVRLTWQDNSNNETGFNIQKSWNGINFYLVGQVSANVVTFDDMYASPGWTYYYRVQAFNENFASAYSNVVAVPVY